jgi:TonB family protein
MVVCSVTACFGVALFTSQAPRHAGIQPASRSWRPIQHKSTFEAMQHSSQPSGCAAEAPPEALTTPNPLSASRGTLRLTVSFIVGTDGRVYSPLVLDGSNGNLDHQVLDLVRHWRYRPALCNGAPTEAEARVEFSTVNSN